MFESTVPKTVFRRVTLAAAVVGCVASVPQARAASVDAAMKERAAATAAAAQKQEAIDQVSDDIDKMSAEYRALLKETRALDVYNKQVETLLESQDKEMESLRRQLDEITHIGREIMPLMSRMIDTLEQFVSLDVPFLPEERSQRVAGLRELMGRADVTISEKYRRLLEAYQIENEFGRTIEAYRGELEADGKTRTVDFLRIGRVALLYQTLDGEETGAWDATAREWTSLPSEYRNSVREGLRIARKQVAPDLLYVPVPAAQEAE